MRRPTSTPATFGALAAALSAMLVLMLSSVDAFSPTLNNNVKLSAALPVQRKSVVLQMSDSGGGGGGGERQRSTKKGLTTILMDKTEEKQEEDEKKEEPWRVILHNDEINTFQHVTRAITKVITTLDRKRAFDICMETHGIGKSTLTKTWKKKAEQYCLNLQREGLTVSIVPDKAFGGGGGGDGDGGGGGGDGPNMS
mmetsp:Transcript_3177/g.9101  ORF Transcript_3177/g.9101 Transcript_3177/m.9101 type:complete len:197 (+) Transcript_3177:204-794(+)